MMMETEAVQEQLAGMRPATKRVLECLIEVDHWPDAALNEIGDPFRRLAMYLVANPDHVKPGDYMPANEGEDTGALGLGAEDPHGSEVRAMLRKLLEARDCAMRAMGHA